VSRNTKDFPAGQSGVPKVFLSAKYRQKFLQKETKETKILSAKKSFFVLFACWPKVFVLVLVLLLVLD